MLKCDVFKNRISLYIDGLLNETEKNEFDNHLEDCEACKKEFNILNEIVSDLNNIRQEGIPLDFKSKLHAKLEGSLKNKEKVNKKKYNRYLKTITSVAACLIVVFTVKLYLDNTNNMNVETLDSDIQPSIMMLDESVIEESMPKVNETISENNNEMGVQVLDAAIEEKAVTARGRKALTKVVEEILEIRIITDNISEAKASISNIITKNDGMIVDDENKNTIITITKEAYNIYTEIKLLYPNITISKDLESLKDDKTELKVKIVIEQSME